METYQDFLNRINSFEKEELSIGDGWFSTNPSLSAKVTKEGQFRNFYGDTVVFDLTQADKEKLSDIIKVLHCNTPECFSEALIKGTLHMTLHNLSCSSYLDSIASEVFFNELKAAELFKKIKDCKILMKTKYVFNMVNTSIVLGLYPADENEYTKLMDLYRLFDCVKTLPYLLTPHITLAYYRQNGFCKESAIKLKDTVSILNKNSFDIELDTKHLYYQKFTNMNNYINIIGL